MREAKEVTHALMNTLRVQASPSAVETPGQPARISARLWFAQPAFVVATTVAALGSLFFAVIWKYSVNIFFDDQWDFLTPFFQHEPTFVELFFWQHGPHREGIGLIPAKFLYPLTHWDARTDSFLVGGSIFAAMLLALLLKRKLCGALSYSDIVIPVMFLTLRQHEGLLGASNPAYAGFPLLMIMLYCLALLQHNRLRRYLSVLLLNFLLIYTGFGLFMGVVTVGVFALECYWNRHHIASLPFTMALGALLVAAASLGSFFLHYTFMPAADCFEIPRHHFFGYLQFMALMFSGFAIPGHPSVSFMTVAGIAILLVAAAILCWHLFHLLKRGRTDAHMVGAVLLSYGLLFSVNAAAGRLCLGLQMAYSSRYITLLIPTFFAIYLYLEANSRLNRRNLVLTLWILLLLPALVRKPGRIVNWYYDTKHRWAECYVRTENMNYCDQLVPFKIYPYPERTGLQQKLDYLKQHRLSLFAKP